MDGPFRGPAPNQRRRAVRVSAPSQRTPEVKAPTPEAPQPVKETAIHTSLKDKPVYKIDKKSGFKKYLFAIVIILLIGALVFGGWFTINNSKSSINGIDTSRHQAVFFTNGQVYFGKLEVLNNESMRLTDIYYLQTQSSIDGESEDESSEPQPAAGQDQGNVQLIKLGDEIHGPNDEMIIFKSQILFYENLKSEGRVSQSIQKHKQSN